MISVEFGLLCTPDSGPRSGPWGLPDDGSGHGKNCTERSLADRGRRIVSRGVVMRAGEQQAASAVVGLSAELSLGEGRGTRYTRSLKPVIVKYTAALVHVHVYGSIDRNGLVHFPKAWHCLDMILGRPLTRLLLESFMVVTWNVRSKCFSRRLRLVYEPDVDLSR